MFHKKKRRKILFYLCFSFIFFTGVAHCAKAPVCLISYAHGNEVHFLNQIALEESASGKGIDIVKSYKYEDLDSGFCESNRSILNQLRGVGYWLWKPWIILNTMKGLPDNSIIIYVDSGALITANLTPLVEKTQSSEFLLFLNGHKNRPYTKRDCYILMGCDSKEYYNATQADAAILFILNNDENRRFVEEWLNFCMDENILTDKKSTLGKELRGFKEHRHDQAVLTLHYMKSNKPGSYLSPKEKSKYFNHHRRRDKNRPL